ncbi:MAG TPA: pyruvate, phosphate dikinase, partial [Acidobacteriota bacterium]|nr:pyruvate, phosphate dikinase [Acidobacteriota bacterium]
MAEKSTKRVYLFANGTADGNGQMKDLLGGKGAGLAEMMLAGLPVPPGFTITTHSCNEYYSAGKVFPAGLWDEVLAAMKTVEQTTGKGFGNPENPLLVSVRSGAKFSMPGMMDTVLNLGLNDVTVQGLAKLTSNERFAQDAYRRFIQMFGRIVLGIPGEKFDHIFEHAKHHKGVHLDTDLTADDLKEIVVKFQSVVFKETGQSFPSDPYKQLELSIQAVFSSWFGKRAVDYRRVNKIPDDLGTAVNIVAMVFGNMGQDSGTGVAFTRNPSTGERLLFGEYLTNAQGEDVVAGIRTPAKIAHLQDEMPEVYAEFAKVAETLERHYKDVQDLEFTIERGKLWMLQTRNAKRTGPAAVKVAVDMVHEGILSKADAVLRVEPAQLDQLLHPRVDPEAAVNLLATGLPASPGAAVGTVVFDPDTAETRGNAGEKVILVRVETSPEDFHGMVAAQAILTARGGMTSHAAVVARGMGKCCVAGCGSLEIDYDARQFKVGDRVIKEGEYITLDGSTGRVIEGQVPLIEPEITGDFREFMSWADEFRTLNVRTNADTPHDSHVARGFGAEGIGLCRTEHMFFEGNRIDMVRQMIMVASEYKRLESERSLIHQEIAKETAKAGGGKEKLAELKKQQAKLDKKIVKPKQLFLGALAALLPMQREDFIGIFTAMNGLPVTIRLLDPPLHEFLPHSVEDMKLLAKKVGLTPKVVEAKIEALREANPMLGHRGCRLGLVYPEITEMQARAIFEAAAHVQQHDVKVLPEVMIPLVGDVQEFVRQEHIVRRVANEVMDATGEKFDYLVGTMIELPRAALTADRIATAAEFFSFGTNDLTQTTFGLSRDDSGTFLPFYVENKILKDDPFQVLDQEGVGQLVEI